MKQLLIAANCIALLGAGVMVMPTVEAAPVRTASQDTTEDVLYLLDGRILHGKLLDETYSTYLFKYVDRKLSLTTEMSIPKSEVVKLERDVPVEGASAATAAGDADPLGSETELTSSTATTAYSAEKLIETYGATLATDSEGVPSFYIVPMKGQMGTDVITEVYREVIEDIRRTNPDMVVLVMDCKETTGEDVFERGFNQEEDDGSEHGLLEIEDYQSLVRMFRNELRDVPQVVWIRDSEGISSLIAMAWDKIYMMPEARLGGLIAVLRDTGATRWPDENVRAKMIAAFVAASKAFLELGGYDQELAEAMANPEHSLSGEWKGRSVDWKLDATGEVVVDTSDSRTADFVAKTAEDYGISQGTAETLDDLAILLGYREYRVLDGTGVEIVERYVTNWRRALDRAFDLWQVVANNSNQNDVVALGRARRAIQQIQSLLRRFVAVERRWARDYGVTLLDLQVMEKLLDEAIARAAQNRQRGGAGGGGGGRMSGGGGGGGGVIDD